ncbi:MAG TPA: VTT domain-containing protein [Xanthomonadales bacterium]|nr:VTT domain-containing protein [Xanthomonadales bacterium]
MEADWLQDLLTWLGDHPHWGWALVFLVAFAESLALIGLLLPGLMILFGVGSLIGLGVMEMLPIWLASSAGAFLGDSLSYALGLRYQEQLLEKWPFSRYPKLMDRGRRFFYRHGEKSVFVGRFIGPLRPIIPAVGGILGMKPQRFLVADFAACIAWAPAFLLPGLFFGATLEVASEYAGRLTVVLVIVMFVLWAAWWLLRVGYTLLASRSARWLRHAIQWSRRHPVLGRIARPLLDPAQPEVLSVTMLGMALVILFWGVIVLAFMGPFAPQPEAFDRSVADFALALRNDLADPAMIGISQLSRWQVTIISAVAVLLWLLGAGRISAATHWLVAIVGGMLIQFLLAWGLRATPQVMASGGTEIPGPSSAMSLATVVLCFFAVMVAREFKRQHRQWPYLVAGLLLVMLFVARVYLGLEWFSGALLGLLLGLAWVSVVGIAYRQRRKEPFSGAVAANIFYAALLFLFVWQVSKNGDEDLARLQTPLIEKQMTAEHWWQSGWNELPIERSVLGSPAARKFNLQIAASPDQLESMLQQQGWKTVEPADWRWLIRSLNPDPDETSLPLIARSFEGRSEYLLMQMDSPGDGRVRSIRFWDSGFRLSPDDTVLYLAQVSEEQLVQRFNVISYWRSVPLSDAQVSAFQSLIPGMEMARTPGGLVLLR